MSLDSLGMVGHPEVIHFICRARNRPETSVWAFLAARLATNLPLFPRRLQVLVLVTVRSARVRLSRTIQGPKSQPESCFGRMCLSPEKRCTHQYGFQVSRVRDKSDGMRRPVSAGCDTLPMFDVLKAQ